MKYCNLCGATVELRVPNGDNMPRHICNHCGEIHYLNPKVVVGCLPRWQEKVLLCRRAIEPRLGLWTLPAGFLENNETTTEGALRETWEEAAARVRIAGLFTLFNLPHVNQIYVMYLADLIEPTFGPGTESLEVALYDERDIPWDQMAFPVVEQTLQLFFDDRRRANFRVHTGDIIRQPGPERVFEVRLLEVGNG
jgi:ADP-ribose pyrophosphatase YjhB (NUDIX family)